MAIEKQVRARFDASGNIVKKFGIMARAASRFGNKTTAAFKRINNQGRKFKGITSGFLKAQVIGGGFRALSQGIGSVVNQFIAFDKAALGATVRFKDVGPEAANFNEKLKEIEKSARDAGATTEFTAAQAADSLDFLARAGFTSAEAMGALGSMINLATASGEEFTQVADMSSDLLGAFGLNVKDTTQKIANLNRVNNVLVKAANSANVTIEHMFETMKVAGPIATSLGIELEEVTALTAIMGNAGIKGSKGATALKNAMLNLATQKKPVLDMLDAIGVKLVTGKDGSLKLTETLKDITAATKDMSKVKRAKVFDAIFGKLAIAGVSNITRSLGELKELKNDLDNVGDVSQKTADIMRTSIDAKLKTLASTATEAGFKVLNAFRVDGKNGIDAMTEAIRDMNVKPFIESLKAMATIVSAIAVGFFEIGAGLGIMAAKMVEISETEAFSIGSDVFKRAEQSGLFVDGVKGRFAEVFGGKPTPNAAEAPARAQAQSVNVGGTINVNGPAGTTAESDGPVGFNLNDLGLNGA